MTNNFDLKKFLIENKLTPNSRTITEAVKPGYRELMDAIEDMHAPGTPERIELEREVLDAIKNREVDVTTFEGNEDAAADFVDKMASELDENDNSALKTSGRNYTNLEDLGEDELRNELNNWSRESLRDWLIQNDRNGVYSDEDSIREFGDVLGKEEAIDVIIGQIQSGRGDLEEENLEEGAWAGMMKGVRAGESGPWSIVAISGGKVIGQSNDIKIQDLIPAKYEALKREYPNARIHIEDAGGQVVWNAPLKEEALTIRERKLIKMAQAILENKGLKLVHAYDKNGKLYGTGESIETKGDKTLVKFDSATEKWFDNKDVKLVK